METERNSTSETGRAATTVWRRGGGKGYGLNYKPTTGSVADTIRLVPGEYRTRQLGPNGEEDTVTEYFPYRYHYDARHKRFINCSGGLYYKSKTKSEPCHACREFWDGMVPDPENPGRKKVGYINMVEGASAITVVHFGKYHKVPSVKNGKVSYKDDGTPWYEWARCQGKMCRLCNDPQTESKDAQRMYWSYMPSIQALLFDLDREINQFCPGCGGLQTIESLAWVCTACGQVAIDPTTTVLDEATIQQLTEDLFKCPACQQSVLLAEQVKCKDCGTDRRANIFDVNLKIKIVKTKPTDKKGTIRISYDPPAAVPKEFEGLMRPLKLNEILAPTPLEEQAKILQLELEPRPGQSLGQKFPVKERETESYDDTPAE